MNIEIWSIGKPNEAFIDEAIKHYLQKVAPYIKLNVEVLQLPKKEATEDAQRLKKAEEAMVLKKLQQQHYLILLDERGKMLDSPGWAQHFQQCMNEGRKTIVLLIGGAFGVTDTVRARAAQVWSLSKLVFPHQLVRLILAEQVYRAYSILAGSPYHHA